jgi:hypothetical protein
VLLKYGAPVDYQYRPNVPLLAAFQSGSMVMVRKLLDAGAPVVPDRLFLRTAVKLEHTAMVEMLLSLGVFAGKGKDDRRWKMVQVALDHGSESIAELLKQRWGFSGEGETGDTPKLL